VPFAHPEHGQSTLPGHADPSAHNRPPPTLSCSVVSLLLSVPRLSSPLQVYLPPRALDERGWSLVPCAVPTRVIKLGLVTHLTPKKRDSSGHVTATVPYLTITNLTNTLYSNIVRERCPIFTQCKPVLTNYDKPVWHP